MKKKPTSTRTKLVTELKYTLEADMPQLQSARIPVQTSFRHMPASPALAARIEAEVDKLGRYFDAITYCHVVVVAPHRHRRIGRRYALHIEIGVPRERLVITHEPAARPVRNAADRAAKADEVDAPRKDINVVVHDAFTVARRRLKEYVRRLRGEVKEHGAPTSVRVASERGAP